jgi:DNA-binding transcriptional ArsR family regulator
MPFDRCPAVRSATTDGVVHAAGPRAAGGQAADPARHALTLRVVSENLPSVATYQADVWTALGDPTRRAIFERLVQRPSAVGELAGEFPVSRPAVSQHLKVLKDARLVFDRPAGNRRIYQVDPTGLGALRADLERFWGQALANYKEAVERRPEEVS